MVERLNQDFCDGEISMKETHHPRFLKHIPIFFSLWISPLPGLIFSWFMFSSSPHRSQLKPKVPHDHMLKLIQDLCTIGPKKYQSSENHNPNSEEQDHRALTLCGVSREGIDEHLAQRNHLGPRSQQTKKGWCVSRSCRMGPPFDSVQLPKKSGWILYGLW